MIQIDTVVEGNRAAVNELVAAARARANSWTTPRARTSKPFNPVEGPATPADAQRRLDEAVSAFIEACRERRAGNQQIRSTVFGVVTVDDYARFQECHTRHHTRQLGG